MRNRQSRDWTPPVTIVTDEPSSLAQPPADHTYKLDPVKDIPRGALKDRPDPFAGKVAAYDAKAHSGFVRKNGKHVAWSGPLQRNGRVKIFDDKSGHDKWLSEQNHHELIDIASKVLHGRNATVFDGLVLDPLRGQPKRTVESLATQFGVPTARIYRIKNECVERIKSELKKTRAAPEFVSPFHQAAREISETCAHCHRTYNLSAWPSEKQLCRGHFWSGTPPDGDINPECLIARRRAMWAEIKAGMTPEKRAELVAKYMAKLKTQGDQYRAWREEEKRRFERDRQDLDAIRRAQMQQCERDRKQAEIDRIFSGPKQ